MDDQPCRVCGEPTGDLDNDGKPDELCQQHFMQFRLQRNRPGGIDDLEAWISRVREDAAK